MNSRFDECLPLILASEGGNSDDPHDPGGRTSRGITQREYDAYHQLKNLPVKDVWTALDIEVHDIYYHYYWLPWCDKFPSGIDYSFFDMTVLQGLHEATILLQRSVGVADDGFIGVITLGAVALANHMASIRAIANQRMVFFRSLPGFKYFGRGWLNRVKNVELASIRMAQTDSTMAIS